MRKFCLLEEGWDNFTRSSRAAAAANRDCR